MADRVNDDNRANRTEDLSEIRVRRDSPVLGTRDAFLELRDKLCDQILRTLEPGIDVTQRSQIRPYIHDRLDVMLEERGIVLNRNERRQLLEAILAGLNSS